MTGGRRAGGGRRRAGYGLAALLLTLQALTGCAPGSAEGTDDGETAVRQLLDRWSTAVRDRDENAYLAAVDPAADAYLAERRQVFGNLADVPLASWRYRLVRLTPGGGQRFTADAELRYGLTGYDTVPVTTAVRLTVVRRGERWYVAGEQPRGGRQLWDQGPVTAVRGAHSLVLGVGQDRERLAALADLADRAVPAVDAAWRDNRWAGRVVVEIPASLDRMGALLDAPASNYRGIAAVTTGEVGGAGTAPADRVIVNPEAYGRLGDFGRRVVLTHETAHVATRAVTTPATPLWLSEGFADWAAYRDTGRTARQAAPELAAEVTAGRPPGSLPEDADFGFAGEPGRLARAYEEGWLACRMIAERWGEDKLVAFYRAVGARQKRAGAVEGALRDVLAVGPEDFVARWREYVAGAF
ncbi:hypothetical protein AB0K09_06100 [Streptomyces sp. NPDC049577]|uniref:hypothetical protein n=1 Tax=Streptomyces sp. NPDC049577 TaxID=3155153 RepID=UPI00343061C0